LDVPSASALHQCVQAHFAEFEKVYLTRYQEQYGCYRPVISRIVEKFLTCGDLTKGFARVRCDACRHEYRTSEFRGRRLPGMKC
jgi:hypothetical protein